MLFSSVLFVGGLLLGLSFAELPARVSCEKNRHHRTHGEASETLNHELFSYCFSVVSFDGKFYIISSLL